MSVWWKGDPPTQQLRNEYKDFPMEQQQGCHVSLLYNSCLMIYRTESEHHSNTHTLVFNVALFIKAWLQNQLGLCPLPEE